MSRQRILTPEQAAEARRLRELRWPVAKIRKAVCPDAGEWVVRRTVAEIPWRYPGRKVDRFVAARLKADGLTYKQIGDHFGASNVAAWKAVQRALRSQQREAA